MRHHFLHHLEDGPMIRTILGSNLLRKKKHGSGRAFRSVRFVYISLTFARVDAHIGCVTLGVGLCMFFVFVEASFSWFPSCFCSGW